MTHIPEGAYDREVIAVLRKALDVAWAKLSLRKPLTVLATAAATIAVDPQSSGTVAAGVARGGNAGLEIRLIGLRHQAAAEDAGRGG